MSFHRESSCLQGGENPPRLSLLQKFKKDTLALSLLLFSLCISNLYLSLPKHFLANPPPAHVTSFSSLLVPLHHKPLSLSLSKFFLKKQSRAAKKTIIPRKIIVVRNPWWFRTWYQRKITRYMFSTPCTSFQCLFSIEQKNKKRFHGVLRKIYRERGVYWLSTYRICMFKNVDSGGWAVRVFFFPMSFLPSMKKKKHKSAPEKNKM